MVEFDVERARADTPGCDHGVHLNNAGASLPPRAVTESVIDYLRREELRGGYETVVRPDRARRSARWRFAVLGRTPANAAASATEPRATTPPDVLTQLEQELALRDRDHAGLFTAHRDR